MMTLSIFLTIIITAMLGYVLLSGIFRVQFSMDGVLLGAFVLIFIMALAYKESNLVIEVMITTGLIILLYTFLKIYSIIKQRHVFFFFHIYKKDAVEVKQNLMKIAHDINIKESSIIYHASKPMLCTLKDISWKDASTFMKKMDKLYAKKPIKLTMYHYWSVIIYFICMVALWRF